MTLTSTDSAPRRQALESYLRANVLDDDFICTKYRQCRCSHRHTFYEGQLHHIGTHYDLRVGHCPTRIMVVGQEYGHGPSRVNCSARSVMIMHSANRRRFKASQGFPSRNPHMKGTTSLLRLLFGLPLGHDHASERIAVNGTPAHLFEAFALVNYLMCSAVADNGATRGLATPLMMTNCQPHFREILRILEPTVLVTQGKRLSNRVLTSFDSAQEDHGLVHTAQIGSNVTVVISLTHPSSRFPTNWGANDRTPYLVEVVAPLIASLRAKLWGYEIKPHGLCGSGDRHG